jgi:putative flippase GtrA
MDQPFSVFRGSLIAWLTWCVGKMKLPSFLTPEVIRWLVVGVAFAAIGLVLIKLLAGILAWPYAIATFCSAEICTLIRFLVVDRWVFNYRRPTWKRLWQYHVANAAGFGIWWTAANVLRASGVHYILAAILAMCCSVGVSMLSNFLWIWRKPAVSVQSTK